MPLADTIFCQVPDVPHAVLLVGLLIDQDIDDRDISVLFCEQSGLAGIDPGVVALLANTSPGPLTHIDCFASCGSLLVTGPLQEPLRAAALVDAAGGLPAALVRVGIPQAIALSYGVGLRHGQALLCVHGRAGLRRRIVERTICRCGGAYGTLTQTAPP
jgi:hypothetical protein